MPPRIVVVDDSSAFLATLRDAVEASSLDVILEECRSEADFRGSLSKWKADSPAAFIIDIMLRWVRPEPDAPPRPEWYTNESRFRAGLRCAKLLQDQVELARVPIVFYTVLERSDVSGDLKAEALAYPVLHKDEGFAVLFRGLERLGVSGAAR